MSQYAANLVYIDAGVLCAFDAWVGRARNTLDEGNRVLNGDNILADGGAVTSLQTDTCRRCTDLSRSLRRRLLSEGASVGTVAILNTVLTSSQKPSVD